MRRHRSNDHRHIRAFGAATLLLLTTLLSSASTAEAAIVPTTACTVDAAGEGALEIGWQPAAGAVAYVVSRSVDAGPDYWRARTTALAVIDTDRTGVLRYSVVAISALGERSVPTPCDDVRNGPTPPTQCVVTPAAGGLTVSWAAGNGAADYIVSRSVDGSPVYWRGRTSQLTFDDTDRAGRLDYSVVTRAADGRRSAAAPCSDRRSVPLTPASCQVVRTGPATLDIEWAQSPGAAEYIVSRRFDGGAAAWRGRTAALRFGDSDRVGSLRYEVVAVSASGQRSDVRPCAGEQADPTTIDMVAVGDMVLCNGGGAQRVSDLLDDLPGPILGLGDFVYEDGTTIEFETCFDPIFGEQRERFDPVPGNHEYHTPGAAPYFAYFGAAAGDPTEGYYATTVGNWQILALNSNCGEVGGCDAASPQGQWLAQQLAAAPPGVCRIAYHHHPRFSSYLPYDDDRALEPLHQQLYDAGTDLVLSGHAHHYERFLPARPDGTVDLDRGSRAFIVGTGGVSLRSNLTPHPLSALRIATTWGVLDLDLRTTDYSWRFVDVEGRILDSGTETCLSAR